ncbi:hypothetical protein RJ639_019736 [Escallonia herrerae]|uniref:Pectin acetylesterase n=1 Tax=Escallonia herrerae TaxID=1293975 RepID=A0AA89AH90_9ASTE|nr:hypothetical protein RJ639_019736 [Escallonia herrerae]
MILVKAEDSGVNITIVENAVATGAAFHDWNRIFVRYCDGSSFTGDVEEVDPRSAANLPPSCTSKMEPTLCFYAQYVVPQIQTPLFILNSAYDTYQVRVHKNTGQIGYLFIERTIYKLLLYPLPIYGWSEMAMAKALGDWYHDRSGFQHIDFKHDLPQSSTKICWSYFENILFPKVGMLVFLICKNQLITVKFETGIYEEQVKFGQRLLKGGPKSNKGWHSRYFFVGSSDKGKLLFDREWNLYCKDFENPGKPTPNNLTKHIFSHIKLRGGLSIDEPLSEQQLEWARIIPRKPVLAGALTPPPAPTISSAFPTETSRVIPPDHSSQIVEKVSVDEDPIFRPRWTLRCDDVGMSDSQISKQYLVHGVLPRDKEVFQNQTHETFACSFAQAMCMMYVSGSKMLSRFEMARQVTTEEAQQKKEAEEATRRAEKLSKQETDYFAQIETLKRRLERAKRRVAEEVKKAHDQGIYDFLDGNVGDEWLKKRVDDGLEIYELGFAKAKEIFAEHFPDIPLDDFVLPAVISPSRETVLPLEAGDAAASHPPGEGPSGNAPEP